MEKELTSIWSISVSFVGKFGQILILNVDMTDICLYVLQINVDTLGSAQPNFLYAEWYAVNDAEVTVGKYYLQRGC